MIPIIAPATHDTASAVVGTPLEPGGAYISSGTWSLVGVEREAPILGDAVARANFTNEIGAFGTVRFLKNVMGLWILESCRREWDRDGRGCDYSELIAGAAALEDFVGFVFPDDLRFLNPSSMVEMLRACLTQTGQPAPQTPVHLTRVVLDSLALRYASVIDTIEAPDRLAHHPHPHRRRRRAKRVPEPGDRERDRPPRCWRDPRRRPRAATSSCRRSRAGRWARSPMAGRFSHAASARRATSHRRGMTGLARGNGTARSRRRGVDNGWGLEAGGWSLSLAPAPRARRLNAARPAGAQPPAPSLQPPP